MDTPIIPNLYAYALEKSREYADRSELPIVAEGADVGYSWLSKFACGKFPNTAYEKVHKLAQFYYERECRDAAENGRAPPPWSFPPMPLPTSSAAPAP